MNLPGNELPAEWTPAAADAFYLNMAAETENLEIGLVLNRWDAGCSVDYIAPRK